MSISTPPPSGQRSIILSSAAAPHVDSDTELQLIEEEGDDAAHAHDTSDPDLDLDAEAEDDDDPHPTPAAPPPPIAVPPRSSVKSSPVVSPNPIVPAPPSPPRVSHSLSSKSKELKEREQRVILPITAAPITRANQDDIVIGIGPHHVDFDSPLPLDNDDRDEIWYEEELTTPPSEPSAVSPRSPRPPPLSSPTPRTPEPGDPFDREVSVIMSRTPSYSQQRRKEQAMVAAIKAERARHPDQIIVPAAPAVSAPASSQQSPEQKGGSGGSGKKVTPTFSYPGGDGFDGFGVAGVTAVSEKILPTSPSSSSPPPTAVRGSLGSAVVVCAFSASVLASLMFEFSAIVLLMHIFHTTLLPASLFGLSESIVHAFSPLLARGLLLRGRARTVLALASTVQQASIALASIVFHVSFTGYAGTDVVWGLLWPLLVLGMLAKLGLCVNRSAMVELGEATRMARVELAASLVAPVLFGAVSTYQEPDIATLVVGAWSILVLPLSVAVACTRVEGPPVTQVVVQTPHTPDADQHAQLSSPPPSTAAPPSSLCLSVFHHPAFLPSLSYALVSLSILAFSVDMIAYLSSVDVSDFALGCGRALTTLIAAIPPLFIDTAVRRLGSDYTGLFAVWMQVLLLAPIPVIFALTDRHAPGEFLTPLFICLCFSSLSLSCFRCIEQPLAPRAGSSSGADYALRFMVHLAVFVSYGLTVVFFDPDWFQVPVVISFVCVVLAALVYTVHARRRGGSSYVTIGGEGEITRVGKAGGEVGRGEEMEGEGDSVRGKKSVGEEWEGEETEDEHHMDESAALPHTPG